MSQQEESTTEEQVSSDNLATAAIISEDPHAVLVEFSSVVADTQEYIIKVSYSHQDRGALIRMFRADHN